MSNYQIKSVCPVVGDWFCVTYYVDLGRWRCWIDRVILWALFVKEGETERVVGLNASGSPFPESYRNDDTVELFYFAGGDASADGRTWLEIFHATTPSIHGVREITDSFASYL